MIATFLSMSRYSYLQNRFPTLRRIIRSALFGDLFEISGVPNVMAYGTIVKNQARSKLGSYLNNSVAPLLYHPSPIHEVEMVKMISPTVSLGAGCYWGTEKYITSDFQKRFPNSIKSAKVGLYVPFDSLLLHILSDLSTMLLS